MLRIIKLEPVEDPRETLEVARIQSNDDFMSVITLVRKGLILSKGKCVTTEGVPLHRYQGAAFALDQLLEAFRIAKEISNVPIDEKE